MTKFHVNANGEAGACRAEKGGCPFGGEKEHFTSPEAARESYETKMNVSSLTRLHKHAAQNLREAIDAAASKQARKDDKFEHDYRDDSGTGYAIEKNSSGKYRWVWSEPDGSQEEGSMGEWVDTPILALRGGADDWDSNGGDYSKKYAGTLRGVATKLEKAQKDKASTSVETKTPSTDFDPTVPSTTRTISDMVQSYNDFEDGDLDTDVDEQIKTAIGHLQNNDPESAWWALDQATQMAGYEDYGVKPYIDGYMGEIDSLR